MRVVWFVASVLSLGTAQARPVADRLEALRGQVVVLNFWATWCAPCKKEIPLLSEIHRRYEPRGVQVVGASIDDPGDKGEVERFARRAKLSYTVWYDATTEDMLAFGFANAVPATGIYDRDGTRMFRIIGEATEQSLVERLEWLLGDRSDPRPAELVLPSGITPEHFKEHEAGKEDEHDEGEREEAGSAVPS